MDEAEIRALVDKQAIRETMMRYCRAIDRLDIDLLRTVYHPDARDDHNVFVGSAEEFYTWVVPLLSAYEVTQHVIANMLIELDGDRAWVETYLIAYHRRRGGEAEVDDVLGGRYIDRFERRDGAWRIADRKVVVDWSRTDPVAAPFSGETMGARFTGGARDRSDPVYRRG